MKKILKIGLLYILVIPALCKAQYVDTLTSKEIRRQRPKYIQIGLGPKLGTLRDDATSPITYQGILANFSLARLGMDKSQESKFTFRYNQGKYSYYRSEGFPVSSQTRMYAIYLNYYRLYQIKNSSNSSWNFKVGGMLDAFADFRINPDFLNAGLGYESFNTLFLSGKAVKTFERTRTREKKILFIKYNLKPRLFQLSYQLNLPVMNAYARNRFAYIGDDGINKKLLPTLFSEYQYKLFSGFRISSEFAYTSQMYNGNMWRFSYLWDAYTTGGKVNRFEMGNHILEFSLLFHLNKPRQK